MNIYSKIRQTIRSACQRCCERKTNDIYIYIYVCVCVCVCVGVCIHRLKSMHTPLGILQGSMRRTYLLIPDEVKVYVCFDFIRKCTCTAKSVCLSLSNRSDDPIKTIIQRRLRRTHLLIPYHGYVRIGVCVCVFICLVCLEKHFRKCFTVIPFT